MKIMKTCRHSLSMHHQDQTKNQLRGQAECSQHLNRHQHMNDIRRRIELQKKSSFFYKQLLHIP